MTLNRVTLADCAPQPWRNGGGMTQELLRWPAHGDWQLRVSVARIERSGPFSRFDGVQRWFAVLSGPGVCLDLPQGTWARTCTRDCTRNCKRTPADDALSFDGADAPMCRLFDDPSKPGAEQATEDLNLMVRAPTDGQPPPANLRRAGHGDVLRGGSRWRGVFAVEPVVLVLPDQTVALPAGSLLWSDGPATDTWQLAAAPLHAGPGPAAWWLSLETP
jgi:uncharacterized protein